ncbi:hypothetical protein BaRGS_00024814 [Batillaria attramentaria]|uniref:Uncharacterized protein n=1 Tax=Batillaria attramentaria TaxID=370345 RepID=A0ABD0KA16_9CAEN
MLASGKASVRVLEYTDSLPRPPGRASAPAHLITGDLVDTGRILVPTTEFSPVPSCPPAVLIVQTDHVVFVTSDVTLLKTAQVVLKTGVLLCASRNADCQFARVISMPICQVEEKVLLPFFPEGVRRLLPLMPASKWQSRFNDENLR